MTISQKAAQLNSLKKKKDQVPFFQGMREEMKKVSWTTKDELILCTRIVIGTVFALGLGIYITDLFLKGALQGIGNFAHFVIGR